MPTGGSAFEAFCQVKYFSPRSWQLTFASDFAEFARDFSVRIAADWPSALLPIVHIFQFVQCPQYNPNTGPSSRFRAPLKRQAATLSPVIVNQHRIGTPLQRG
jgi:hypothetical protein